MVDVKDACKRPYDKELIIKPSAFKFITKRDGEDDIIIPLYGLIER